MPVAVRAGRRVGAGGRYKESRSRGQAGCGRRARRLSRRPGSARRRSRCAAGRLPPGVARRAAGSGPHAPAGPLRPSRISGRTAAAHEASTCSASRSCSPLRRTPASAVINRRRAPRENPRDQASDCTTPSGAAGGAALPGGVARRRCGSVRQGEAARGRGPTRSGFPGRACEARAIVGSTRSGRRRRRPRADVPAASVPRNASTARRPKTSPSSSELLASRLAPCAPVHATSPAAYSPGTEVRPRRSVDTPPIQ